MTTAVAAPVTSVDVGVPWHYGDPLREQRWLVAGSALVDLSHRGVVTVSGPDRLSWLHDLTTADVRTLRPNESRIALVLDPQGRVLHELHLVDDGSTTWLCVEQATTPDLVKYLTQMKFMLAVEVVDQTKDVAIVGQFGSVRIPGAIIAWSAPPEWTATGVTSSGMDRGGDATKYVPSRPGGFDAVEYFVPRDKLPEFLAAGQHLAGTWAWEALRAGAAVPRLGVDTDARSLPHELGWIGPAVHLAKGCYRGQESVARTHNMGKPPRRLVLLHLDGTADVDVVSGDPVTADNVVVGRVGTVAVHYEMGPIALAVVKRRIDPATPLQAGSVAATQEVVVV